MKKVGLLIDGKMIESENGDIFQRINLISREVSTEATAALPKDIDLAIESAQRGFLMWYALKQTERRKRLLTAADLIEQRIEDFIQIARKETGIN